MLTSLFFLALAMQTAALCDVSLRCKEHCFAEGAEHNGKLRVRVSRVTGLMTVVVLQKACDIPLQQRSTEM